MSAEARLARLEGALSPKGATLLWLTDAHRFPTLPAYVGWLVDQPADAAPFWRVPEQAERAVRTAMRGERRDTLEAAARQAVRDAVFLVELVIRLNVAAEETLRVEGLRYAALAAEAEFETGRQGRRTKAGCWATWRGAASVWVTNLSVAEAAQELLERRYLDGRDVLFPDLGREWHALFEAAERLPGLGASVAERRKGRSRNAGPWTPAACGTALSRRAEADAACLADAARAAALDLLGDTDGAVAIAERRLHSRVR